MTQRFFRATQGIYESVRHGLDQTWGHRDGETAFMPAMYAPKDAAGLVYLAVDAAWCEFPAVAAILPSLIADGAVEEIDAAAYAATVFE